MREPKVRQLAIVFDRPNETYHPGELLTGKVLVEFTEPNKIRGLRVEVFGEAVVGWPVSVPKPNEQGQSEEVFTNSHEEYISLKFYLLGSENGRAIELPIAQLSYPFSIQLPFDLPSSLEHSYGHIRYKLRAVFERPWKFDYDVQTAFTIITNYDLNRKPQALEPIREDIYKSFCCFCVWPLGKVHLIISVPASGFVPGEMIPVTVQCQNESTVSISKIKLYLNRMLKFYAMAPKRDTKEEDVVVAETKCENPYNTSFEENVLVQLKVPPLASSGLEFCAIIDLSYSLKVVISFSGLHCSIERTFPVLIGTVPLGSLSETYDASTAMVSPAASAPLLQGQPSGNMPPQFVPQTISMPQPESTSSIVQTNPSHPGGWDLTNLSPPPYEFASGTPGYPGQNYVPVNAGFDVPVSEKRY